MKIGEINRTYVYFTSNAGAEARLSYTGNHGWRVQSKDPQSGDYNDVGASQRLARTLGEEMPLRTEEIGTNVRCGVLTVTAPDGSAAKINPKTGTLTFVTPSGRTANVVTDVTFGDGKAGIKGKLGKTEGVYGSGERYDKTNLRGKRLDLFTYDIWDEIHACYMVIPVFSSSNGYGFFFNRYERMIADLGKENPEEWSIVITDAPVDCYFFAVDEIADVIYGYTALSGFAAAKPAEWTYGMLVCRYSPDFCTKKGIYNAIKKHEEYNLPWSGLVLEGFSFYDPAHYDDVKEICDYVHSLGKKVLSYMFVGAAVKEGRPEGYYMLAQLPDGTTTEKLAAVREGTYNPDFGNASRAYAYPDITNPTVREWFFDGMWEKMSKELGIDGTKIDFCELIPENLPILYYDKREETRGTHHWWPTAFCSMYYKKLSEKPDGGMCFTRGGGIGSQRNPYMWAGDQSRTRDRLAWQLTCLLNSGLSGVPFMSYDMSGYQYRVGCGRILYNDDTCERYVEGKEPFPLDEEAHIFIRGTEFTTFTICMQTHGKVRRSYDFAEEGDTVTTDIYREYVNLHNKLTPYINEYVDEAYRTGMPVARHLILKYRDDAKVRDISDEYLFGDAFLIAPELTCNDVRDIYLPAGEWKDLNTGKEYSVDAKGLTLKGYKVARAEIPVFLNKNTDSKTYKQVLGAIETSFATLKKFKYGTEA